MNSIVRWLINEDLPQILAIDKMCHEKAWKDRCFRQILQRQHVIGSTSKKGTEILGYLITEFLEWSESIMIVRMGIHPDCRRQGLGSQLIQAVQSHHLKQNNDYRHLYAPVAERMLGTQMFLKHCGFKAVGKLPNGKDGDDMYLMRLTFSIPSTQLVN